MLHRGHSNSIRLPGLGLCFLVVFSWRLRSCMRAKLSVHPSNEQANGFKFKFSALLVVPFATLVPFLCLRRRWVFRFLPQSSSDESSLSGVYSDRGLSFLRRFLVVRDDDGPAIAFPSDVVNEDCCHGQPHSAQIPNNENSPFPSSSSRSPSCSVWVLYFDPSCSFASDPPAPRFL